MTGRGVPLSVSLDGDDHDDGALLLMGAGRDDNERCT